MNIRKLLSLKITSVIFIFFISIFINTAAAQNLAATFEPSNELSTTKVDHQPWNGILTKYLKPSDQGINLFDYAGVSEVDKTLLKSYIETLSTIDPLQLNKNEQMAYWINLYNAVTIDVVLAAYPVDTIRKIDAPIFRTGPWKKKRVTINNNELSLDNIEHDILRPIFKDARIHYGVNCASIGCPNLQTVAFTGDNVDALLTEGAKQYVNHPRGVSINNGKLIVSSIYQWFKEDFGSKDQAIIEHLKQYAEEDLRNQLSNISKINDDDYDWDLNGI